MLQLDDLTSAVHTRQDSGVEVAPQAAVHGIQLANSPPPPPPRPPPPPPPPGAAPQQDPSHSITLSLPL